MSELNNPETVEIIEDPTVIVEPTRIEKIKALAKKLLVPTLAVVGAGTLVVLSAHGRRIETLESDVEILQIENDYEGDDEPTVVLDLNSDEEN